MLCDERRKKQVNTTLDRDSEKEKKPKAKKKKMKANVCSIFQNSKRRCYSTYIFITLSKITNQTHENCNYEQPNSLSMFSKQ